jgi:histidinol-phosphate aminotransferase
VKPTGSSFNSFLVPAARAVPSNAAYLAHLAAAADNPGLIRLASNENTEPPSPRVRAALTGAYADANLSPPPTPPLQLALAALHGVEPAQVVVTAGSTEVIEAAFRTFIRAGCEAVIPDPTWPVYRRRLQALEAHVVAVPLALDKGGYHYDADPLIAAITDATRLVVVCSPNNPTGNTMADADLRRVADVGVPLLLDAAYADFDPNGNPMRLVHDYDNVIVTRTFSKAYCLAGVRVGYAVGNAELLDHVDRFLVPGSSISRPALHAGLAALADEEYHRHQVERIVGERERLLPALGELGLEAYPSAGNFVAVDCSARKDGAAGLAAALLAHGIVVRPLDTLLRISIGRRDENDALLEAVALALAVDGES